MTRHGYSARRTLNESSAAKPSRAGVGLALGGGFARGFAHLGVLQVLEQNHVPISHIAGTSVGSILGAAYASGAPLSRIIETCRTLRLRDIARWRVGRPGSDARHSRHWRCHGNWDFRWHAGWPPRRPYKHLSGCEPRRERRAKTPA